MNKTNNATALTTALEQADVVKQELINEVSAIIITNATVEVKTAEQSDKASALLQTVKEMQKTIDRKMKALVEPLKNVAKEIESEFKKVKEPLNNLEASLKRKLLEFVQEQKRIAEEKRNEAQRIAEEEKKKLECALNSDNALLRDIAQQKAKAIDNEAESAIALAQVKSSFTGVTGQRKVTTRVIWTYELIDLSKVPREYLKLDEGAVNSAVKSGVREIAGIRIYQKEIIST